jgi:hypothetical protein
MSAYFAISEYAAYLDEEASGNISARERYIRQPLLKRFVNDSKTIYNQTIHDPHSLPDFSKLSPEGQDFFSDPLGRLSLIRSRHPELATWIRYFVENTGLDPANAHRIYRFGSRTLAELYDDSYGGPLSEATGNKFLKTLIYNRSNLRLPIIQDELTAANAELAPVWRSNLASPDGLLSEPPKLILKSLPTPEQMIADYDYTEFHEGLMRAAEGYPIRTFVTQIPRTQR